MWVIILKDQSHSDSPAAVKNPQGHFTGMQTVLRSVIALTSQNFEGKNLKKFVYWTRDFFANKE